MNTIGSKAFWGDVKGFIKDMPTSMKLLWVFCAAAGVILITMIIIFGFILFAKLAHADTDIYTKTFRYAQQSVYQNTQACSCSMAMIDGSEAWKDGDDVLLYTAVYEISGGIGPQKSRRVRLEVKYFKKPGAFASTYIDLANPPKIKLNITGVKN